MPSASRGIALKLLATLAFAIMNALIKSLAHLPVGEIVCFRCVFALAPVLIIAAMNGDWVRAVRTTRPRLHVVRALTGTLSMFCYFTAVTLLPLADSTAVGFMMPIFAVLLSARVLREKVDAHRIAAVLAGFAGVMLMVSPHAGLALPAPGTSPAGMAVGLLGAFLAAFVVVFIRQMSATETSEAIVFYFMLTCSVVSGASMFFFFVRPSLPELGLLVATGILGGIGQVAMTYSYRYAEPSLLAPFDYAAIVWATVLGYIVFAEVPAPMVLAGTAVVIAAGLSIAWRQRQLGGEASIAE